MRRAQLIAMAQPQIVRLTWPRVLVGGSTVYALLTAAAVNTQDIDLVPGVLVLSAALIPVVFLV